MFLCSQPNSGPKLRIGYMGSGGCHKQEKLFLINYCVKIAVQNYWMRGELWDNSLLPRHPQKKILEFWQPVTQKSYHGIVYQNEHNEIILIQVTEGIDMDRSDTRKSSSDKWQNLWRRSQIISKLRQLSEKFWQNSPPLGSLQTYF